MTTPRTDARTDARTRRVRTTAMLAVLAFVAVACGPRFDRSELVVADGPLVSQPGAVDGASGGDVVTAPNDEAFAPTDGSTDGTFDGTTDGTSDGADAGAGGAVTATAGSSGGGSVASGGGSTGGGGSGGSTSGGTASGGSTGSGTGGGTSGAPAASGSSDPGPAPGVTSDTIRIGYLVPETGAAPIPTEWRDGANLYWEVNDIAGRKVELLIRNTNSNTTTAVQEARKLITDEKVFTIITLDRLEVQDAVARELEARDFPNIMIQSPTPPPAYEDTFVVSIDHIVQGRAIAQFFAKDLASKGKRVAVVRENTNALKPGADAFVAEAKRLGLEVVAHETIDPQAKQYSNTVLSLQQKQADIVWLYMAPEPAITVINQSGEAYRPTWFANSISWNFDLIHPLTPNLDGRAYAFSPWVSLSSPRTKAYKDAYRARNGSEPDDIGLVGWGVGEVVDLSISAAGRQLGHDSFRAAMRNLNVTPQVWAPLDFRGGGPIGTAAVSVFETKNGGWVSMGDFRSFR